MKSQSIPVLQSTVAATVAGDDLRCGDYIAVLTQTCELPSFLWDNSDFRLSPHELVRLQVIPCDAGLPLKVFAICLPFVYVFPPGKKEVKTLDLRRMQLVRLNKTHAKTVWKQMQQPRERNPRLDD